MNPIIILLLCIVAGAVMELLTRVVEDYRRACYFQWLKKEGVLQ